MNNSIEELVGVLVTLKKDWELYLKPFGIKSVTRLTNKSGELILKSLLVKKN
jgi:hypothetical protein